MAGIPDPLKNNPAETKEGRLSTLRPVGKNRVSDEILVQLTELILDGVYKPGEKLPTERELAVRFGVNRASLREALRRMEVMGMVYIRQGGGIYVQDYAAHAGIEFISFLVQNGIDLNKDLILDMAEMRIQVGNMMLRMAAKNMTEESAAALQKAFDDIVGAVPAQRQNGELDFAFYYEVAKAAKNRIFIFLMNTIRDVMSKVIGVYFEVADNPKTSVALYRDLLGALQNRDGDKAMEIFERQARRDDAMLAALLEGMD